MLVENKVVDYSDDLKFSVKAANDRFGLMGERVLAFARIQLDPTIYKKQPQY